MPVEVARVPECSALGAAICAGVGARLYKSVVDGVERFVGAQHSFAPDPARHSAYQSHYDHWLEMRAVRQKADEIAESSAIQAIMATAAKHVGRGVSKPIVLRPNILVTAAMDDEALAALHNLGNVRYESFRETLRLLAGEDLVEALTGVQVFITEVDAVDAEVLGKLPDLRVIASCRGHAVNIDIEACTAHGILVLTTPERNADAVADLTVCFMLMLARKLPEATRFLYQPGQAGDVGRMGRAFEGLQGHELWHKTIGIVGLGAVGQRVAKRLQPFAVRVIAYDPFLSPEKAILLNVERVSLEQLLGESDFVTLHAAVTDPLRALLGPAEIAKMKPGAYLVNTARAALVDQDALVSALKNGRIAGAAVDVFPIEPPGPDHPLLQLANVIATPHVGGNTFEVSSHQGASVAANLSRLLRREQPQNVANRESLEHFSWTAPRPAPSPEVLERLRQYSRPSVTDLSVVSEEISSTSKPSPGLLIATGPEPLQVSPPRAAKNQGLLSGLKNAFLSRRTKESVAPNTLSNAGPRNGNSNGYQNDSVGSQELRVRMEKVLGNLAQQANRDANILSFAGGRQLTVRYDLKDVNLLFYMTFDHGAVRCGLGDPPDKPEVMLKMNAEILDKLLLGRENGAKAAMSGKLSFTGDIIKAMSLQRIEKDLNRLYTAARADVRDLDAIFARTAHEASPQSNPPAPGEHAKTPAHGEVAGAGGILVGDIRDELVHAVEELYAHGLITATGGNASVRIPGKDEVWITPNSLFKGRLRADLLVRVDLGGSAIGDSPYAPSSERMLHCAMYGNSPSTCAVIHCHAPKTTILGLASLPFLPISTEAAFIGEIPRVPFIMPGTRELAEAVGAAVKDGAAVIMQNHGLVVRGPDLRHTIDVTLVIERTAEQLIACHTLGRIPPVLPDEIVTTLRNLGEMIA